MRHIPWFTLVAVAAFSASPLGQSVLRDSFVSGEKLSNDIAQFILLVVLGIAIAMSAAEWAIKIWLRRRRLRSENRG